MIIDENDSLEHHGVLGMRWRSPTKRGTPITPKTVVGTRHVVPAGPALFKAGKEFSDAKGAHNKQGANFIASMQLVKKVKSLLSSGHNKEAAAFLKDTARNSAKVKSLLSSGHNKEAAALLTKIAKSASDTKPKTPTKVLTKTAAKTQSKTNSKTSAATVLKIKTGPKQ